MYAAVGQCLAKPKSTNLICPVAEISTFSSVYPGAVDFERVAVNAVGRVVKKQRALLDLLGKLENARGLLESIKEIGDTVKEVSEADC